LLEKASPLQQLKHGLLARGHDYKIHEEAALAKDAGGKCPNKRIWILSKALYGLDEARRK